MLPPNERWAVPADRAAADGLGNRYRYAEPGKLEIPHDDADSTVFDFGGWDSEVATRRDGGGTLTFVTISPGANGFELWSPTRTASGG